MGLELRSVDVAGVTASALAPCSSDGAEAIVSRVDTDGAQWWAMGDLDTAEAGRRSAAGVGGVVDRRLLHALWELPHGMPVDEDRLSDLDRLTIQGAPAGLVDRHDRRLTRRFQPAMNVTCAVVVSARADAAVRRLSMIPAIYKRVAIVGVGSIGRTTAEKAERRGIGVVSVAGPEPRVLSSPSPPVTGRPAVYRWWVNELAYDAHLTAKVS